MEDTPQTGETTQENTTTVDTSSAPTQDNASTNAGVTSPKDAEKKDLEIKMLRNRLDALTKEKESALNKTLEEKEDYRSIAERATSQLEELLKEKEEAQISQQRETATKEVLKDFDTKVAEIAQTAGLRAESDTEEAREAFKNKLEEIASKIGSTAPTVQGSNPLPETPQEVSKVEYTPRVKSIGADLVQNRQAVAFNSVAANKQLKNLESVKAMKQIAGVEVQEI